MTKSNKITYTLLVEGKTEECFLKGYLPIISQAVSKQLTYSSRLKLTYTNAGKDRVMGSIEKFCKGILEIGTPNHLLIIAVDLDENDLDGGKTNNLLTEIKGKLPDKFNKNKSVILIPIQTTDYWLTYLSDKKIGISTLEGKDKKQIKKELFAGKYIEETVNGILKNKTLSDFEHLAKQSKSFSHFHKTIQDVLNHYPFEG